MIPTVGVALHWIALAFGYLAEVVFVAFAVFALATEGFYRWRGPDEPSNVTPLHRQSNVRVVSGKDGAA